MTYEELFKEFGKLFIKIAKGELKAEEQIELFKIFKQLVELEETATEA